MRYLTLLLSLVVSICAKTPEEVVHDYSALIKTEGMGSIAKIMHPEELEKFQGMMEPVVEIAFSDTEARKLFSIFADPSDPLKLRRLSPEEFMATFFQWLEKVQPMVVEVMKGSTFEVIGHVREGEASHVVTRARMNIQGLEIEKLSVISTKDYKGEARMMLSGEIKQLAETLKRSMKKPQE